MSGPARERVHTCERFAFIVRAPLPEVAVRYERTSLEQASDDIVRAMAAQDRVAGPEWARQIAAHLRTRSPH